MALQKLELGTAADDGTGDSLRVGGDKLNDNFIEVYTALGDGDALSSGISASATVIALTNPNISGVVAGTQTSATITTLTSTTVNAGTATIAAGSITDSSGAITFVNENLVTTGTLGAGASTLGALGVGAITTTGAFKGADGFTIGNASVAAIMTLASTGIVTFVDDIILKDAATIGVASSTSAITIASTGIVTFVDDIVLKDAATIGVASSTSAITIASTGIVSFIDDIAIKDGGTIGNATTAAAITIEADGDIVLSDDLYISGGLIDLKNEGSVSQLKFYCESSNAHAQTLQSAPHALASSAVCVLPTLSGTLVGSGDSGTVTGTMLAAITAVNKIGLAAIDIDGGTDVGADLTAADLIIIDDGAGGTNRKAALSRVVTLTSGEATALAIALG